MRLKLWQVDAFATRALEGNPAAVVPLDSWISDNLMLAIAGENNLAETAFFVKKASGAYDLRWFTPNSEVDLCGHATLACAFVVFSFLDRALDKVSFMTRSGELTVARGLDGRNGMSLPSDIVLPYHSTVDVAQQIREALDAPPPKKLFKGTYLMAVWNDALIVRGLKGPGGIERVLHDQGVWGLIATAPGDEGYDMVSRFFAPAKAVPEDSVTGSAHSALTPFWAKRLGKKQLKARQASPRGGDLYCADNGDRTFIAGDCALYLTGEIEV